MPYLLKIAKIRKSFNFFFITYVLRDTHEIDSALSSLSRVARERLITASVWELNFNTILYQLLKLINKNTPVDSKVKISALRSLQDIW